MENWLDKYRPKKLSDVMGDKYQIGRIEQFIKQFAKKKIDTNKISSPNIIITGSNGIGKTLIVDLILKENDIEKVVADLSNISIIRKTKKKDKIDKEMTSTNRTIKSYYLSLVNSYSFSSIGDNIINRNIALVFDDVSNISNPKEKEAIKLLVKLNNKQKKIPIIIIANTKHSKTINELRKMVTYIVKDINNSNKKEGKKIVNEVLLKAPDYLQIFQFVKKICKEENLNLVTKKTDEENIYVQLIEHAQYDIRRLINILEELKMMHDDSEITYNDFVTYCDTSKTKDLDHGIYEATRILLNKYVDIDTALSLYGEERSTIPLMVHENYPLNIKHQYPKLPLKDQMEMIFNISKSISESDKIDGLIYSNQCWNLQSVHGFYSCVLPSYYINKHPDKLCNKEKYRYTQDYNKTSIKKINNKVIKKAQENQFLKKVSIYDFLYMASILKTLFENKKWKKIAELMKPYDLTLKEIESLIKIDKIKKSKNVLTGKQKILLKELLETNE